MRTTGEMPKRIPPWRKRPVVAADLLALPEWTVFLDVIDSAWQIIGDASTPARFCMAGEEGARTADAVMLPARVLYRPYYAPWDD
jgi:hypothetical protein